MFPMKRVISLHGIRTRGPWQKDIAPLLAENGFVPHPLDFGYFMALGDPYHNYHSWDSGSDSGSCLSS